MYTLYAYLPFFYSLITVFSGPKRVAVLQ